MHRAIAAIVAAVLFAAAATAAAQPPRAVITGPTQSRLGDLVILDASQSSGSSYAWALIGSDKTYLPVDGGLRVVFATGTAGEYTFALVAAGTNANGGAAVDVALWKIAVVDDRPKPPPDPKPDVPPDPIEGRLSVIVLREQSTLTADQAATLLQLRTASLFAARGPPELLILDLEQRASDSRTAAIVKLYASKIPPGSAAPYVFFVVAGDDGRAVIVEHGPLPAAADEVLQRAEALSR